MRCEHEMKVLFLGELALKNGGRACVALVLFFVLCVGGWCILFSWVRGFGVESHEDRTNNCESV